MVCTYTNLVFKCIVVYPKKDALFRMHVRLVKLVLAFNFCWSVVFSVSPAYKDNGY